jgi:putative ABC transport system permease protein
LIRSSTKLPVSMAPERALLVFSMVLVMCLGSAMFAMRKLAEADPADIF